MSDCVMVPREKLEQFRDAFAEELAAYDIDPPIEHVKRGHDDCVALLAAVQPLTDDRMRTVYCDWYVTAECHTTIEAIFNEGFRQAEQAHGITGGGNGS